MNSIGWFGVPGKRCRDPKVHVVREGKAICETVFSHGTEFQWCAEENAMCMVECKRCNAF